MSDGGRQIREMYAKFNIDDVAGAGALLHPDAELHQNRELPDADVFRGRAEFERGLNDFLGEWTEFRFKVIETVGEDPLWIRVGISGRGRSSGIALENEVFHVWELREGLPFRCRVFLGEEESRAAAGIVAR